MAASSSFVAEDFRKLPKVELHCHFGGSVRAETAAQLFAQRDGLTAEEAMQKARPLEIPADENGLPQEPKENYRGFPISYDAHRNDPAAVAVVAKQILRDLLEDGVVYAEVRTGGGDKAKLEVMFDAFRAAQEAVGVDMATVLRFILSIKRDGTIDEAKRCVENAIALRDRGVLGVDFCGVNTRDHPFTAEHAELVRVAKDAGLAFCPHFAELAGEKDLQAILDAGPSRLGHGMFIADDVMAADILKKKIAFECCVASNLNTMNRDRAAGTPPITANEHPLVEWYAKGQPFVLCTDNPGLLAQWPLSVHYQWAAAALKLSPHGAWRLSFSAIDHTFADDEVKEQLRAKFRAHPWSQA